MASLAACVLLTLAAGCAGAPPRSFAAPGWFAMAPTREVVRVRGWPSGPMPLSFAIKAGGTVYASGLAGFDMRAKRLVPGGVAAETAQALRNLEEVMTAWSTQAACREWTFPPRGSSTAERLPRRRRPSRTSTPS
mmetsp:Transcript_76468/g.238164  ORF Transcript_76468/g.238164 Transcript_76468/m.238164 type:complete len:135 (-) Transcript_76468:232-636(-)